MDKALDRGDCRTMYHMIQTKGGGREGQSTVAEQSVLKWLFKIQHKNLRGDAKEKTLNRHLNRH